MIFGLLLEKPVSNLVDGLENRHCSRDFRSIGWNQLSGVFESFYFCYDVVE